LVNKDISGNDSRDDRDGDEKLSKFHGQVMLELSGRALGANGRWLGIGHENDGVTR
jgi:hypothetical protein